MKKTIRLSSAFTGFFAGNLAFIRSGEYTAGLIALPPSPAFIPCLPCCNIFATDDVGKHESPALLIFLWAVRVLIGVFG